MARLRGVFAKKGAKRNHFRNRADDDTGARLAYHRLAINDGGNIMAVDEDRPERMFVPDPAIHTSDHQIVEALQSIAESLCWVEHHLKLIRVESPPQ